MRLWNCKLIFFVVFIMLSFSNIVNAQNSKTGDDKEHKTEKEKINIKKLKKEARNAVKSTNFSQAESILEKAVAASTDAKSDAGLFNMLMNVEHGLADAENRKIYLKNNPDTAKYFSYIYKVYLYGLTCDSLDRVPDHKGRVKPQYTTNVSSRLVSYRNNIKSAGKFFYNKGKYAEAYKYFDLFISTLNNPLITSAKNARYDADSLSIMRLAVFSAYNSSDYESVMKYLDRVMEDTVAYATLCQIGSKTEMALGDTLKAAAYLYDGWRSDPMREYFYITLVEYYIDAKLYQNAYDIVADQLNINPQNRRLWYIKGKCQQCLDSLDAAIVSYEHAIIIQDSDAQSYSSIGDIYVTKAQRTYRANNNKVGTSAYSHAKTQETEYYRKALANYEKARKYAPNDPTLWYEGLREVYFKLNMGRQLNQLEKDKLQTVS